VPGTTRQHANESATALQRPSLDFHPLLLAGHSQTGHLNHRGDLFPGTGSTTSGRHSPSQLSDDLRPADHVPRGCYPSGLAPYAADSRPGIVSAKSPWRFRGTEHRSIPLPIGAGVSQFGTVFDRTHWQALVVGPLVVELFVVGSFPRSPGVVSHPVPPVTRSGTPHASQVERTTRVRTPWAGFAPALHHRGLPRKPARKVCRCRPGSRDSRSRPPGVHTYRIEWRDYFWREALLPYKGSVRLRSQRLLRQASVEHGQATLVASGSTGQHPTERW
jgi:hypothetical protein